MYKHEILFQDYLELKSKESKDCIMGFQEYNEPGKDIEIKVNLINGDWLRVYYNDSDIDWC
ncbi:hypothetical protein K2F40_16370 [Clostridium sp. CM028]|uniref:hypothetical protein n=1 Tax=Clostridium TaxID=1485 RepID=UPI0013EE5BF9|nr:MULTISPECIES: hypothetical protein [Clostridium]MBW9147234.1 hypothetical protein [Clostridium sp. CM027]MBW9150519.1 hypothetical protein [Clostridium sp. CM028]MBZ9608816.1 hypothetical protein [Clostridium estertheticum]UVE40853.1 hypothetical protein KTC92_17560 [Clostridium sp. CM027]WLC61519.1 hypothetical protein KTC94_15845 [Clostridium sp. CM028]